MKKQFRDFKSAREFVQKLNLKNKTEWREYYKSGDRPNDVPSSPQEVYKKEWKGFGDWLGTGNIASQNKQFISFEETREFVRSLGLKSVREWVEYCTSGNKPDNIPANPSRKYKNKGWIDFGDFLGTGTVAFFNIQFRPFKEAREFARALNLNTTKEWKEYCKSGNKPDDIPSSPEKTYKNDFKGLGDWLGTGRIAPKDKVFRPFKEAREFARALNLKGYKDWEKYCKTGNKPDDIPSSPEGTYNGKGWIGYADWLGNEWCSFKEAREFAQKLGLKSKTQWVKYCASGNKPDDMVSNPEKTYKNEWKGYGDFLGTGTVATFNIQYRPFKEAREFVRSLGLKNWKEWQEYCKSGNKPDDIPSNPGRTYKEWKKK